MKPGSWTGWVVAVIVAVVLSVLTTLGLECLFRHGEGGGGCLPGDCGGRCGESAGHGKSR
jgi:hypothetical protein